MVNLEYLNLQGNKLTDTKDGEFFANIQGLKNLRKLCIGNNPVSDTEIECDRIRDFVKEHLPNCVVYF